ncbi:MAG: adenylosuccinate synthase [Candidatus Cloacimonetes bacterium]|jgi:adenylosuccinate synthase|nr:adenylosuccinate synthase [Candidatus Cloacimonadota bacterium]
MSSLTVLGCMWGDEGKAKIVDFLGVDADVVARFQGGANAGHTIVLNEAKYVFHTVPSGILYPKAKCVIGAGTVIDPFGLRDEMKALMDQGIMFDQRMFIDVRAGLVLPLHKQLDGSTEAELGASKIGTTGKGIGPSYADQAARSGLRFGDLAHPGWLKQRLESLYAYHDLEPKDLQNDLDELAAAWEFLKPFSAQADALLREWYLAGEAILFEGAQGTLLDLTYGTYPYVTSSHTITGAASTGTGFPPRWLDRILGVYKAYATRVGEGPFPTELFDATGERIRRVGNEFGATTGRPRRIGWFDAVGARYTASLNGLDAMAVTLLDVLSGLPELKICTGYWLDGQRLPGYAPHPLDLARVEPEYLILPGWDQDIGQARSLARLPQAAKEYLEAVQDLVEIPIELVSVGKDRSQTIVVK